MTISIKQEQVLKDGDYVKELSNVEWNLLICIQDSPIYPLYEWAKQKSLIFVDGRIEHYHLGNCKAQYSFEAFKQLCENTFK